MDINLPLILLIAVGVTGVVWLYDLVALRGPRLRAIEKLNEQFPDLEESQRGNNEAYAAAYVALAAEPVVVEYSKSFFPVLFLVFALRSFLIEPFQIPSESMVPTLEVGDFIAVNKFSYGIRMPVFRTKLIPIGSPERGDVMVFFPPNETRYFIKRVIGLPGDTVRYTNHELFINGVKAEQTLVEQENVTRMDQCIARGGRNVIVDEVVGDEAYRARKCSIPGRLSVDGTWHVPEGHYLMMGDNRDNSSDGREWGFVPEERVVGKAFAIWMHWDKLLSLPSFSRAGGI